MVIHPGSGLIRYAVKLIYDAQIMIKKERLRIQTR